MREKRLKFLGEKKSDRSAIINETYSKKRFESKGRDQCN